MECVFEDVHVCRQTCDHPLAAQGYDFYIDNYPSGAKAVLGILDYQLLIDLQLDHIYTSWYFYLSIGLLAASLAACTTTRQLPAVKVRPLRAHVSACVHGNLHIAKAAPQISQPGLICVTQTASV